MKNLNNFEIDLIETARGGQWDIEMNPDDPVRASIIAGNVLRTIGPRVSDGRYMPGTQLRIRALAAYIVRSPGGQKYENLEIDGSFGGISFIQTDDPRLQTLFLAAENARMSACNGSTLAMERIPALVIPVLDIESVEESVV